MKEFINALQTHTSCELRFDEISKTIYSVDASIYEVVPLGIALPKNRQELLEVIQIAHKYDVPIIPRGAATGITGGCLGKGLIIDVSKYYNKILAIDSENKTATIQPGVIQDDLNAALYPYGYRLGPDTSTGDRATIGGMTANNAAGARSLVYGTMSDAVLEIELILSDGEVITFKTINEEGWKKKCLQANREGEIYRTFDSLRKDYAQEIQAKLPPIPRRVSGYNLTELIQSFPINTAKILVGSEGTLGIFSSIKVTIDPLPVQTDLVVYNFSTMADAMKAIQPLLSYSPLSLEMIDDKIIEAGKASPSMRGKTSWLPEDAKILIIAEFPKGKKIDGEQNAKVISDSPTISQVWALRKAGLGLLLSKRTYSRAVAFIEDVSVPPEHLPEFMDKFLHYLEQCNKTAGIYGHVGSGCLHIRPYLDLRHQEERDLAEKMMVDVAALIQESGGAMSGEHGDGLVRSWLNKRLFGEKLYQAFEKVKYAFDPHNRMNPYKIVDGHKFAENLRKSPKAKEETFFSFDNGEGIGFSADLCNGNGFCRKKTGLMCPSFQVTNDEYDTTRARANAFRSIFDEKYPIKDLADPGLQDILDLCIQCKGCKTECPSQVDMAKMKSEALYHYQEENGYSLKSRLFANLAPLYKIGAAFPKVFNQMSQLIKGFMGIAKERTLPNLAPKPFHYHSEEKTPSVVLFIDTYTKYIHPQIGYAAIDVLQFLGYKVHPVYDLCCGRTLISKGFLPEAKKKAHTLIQKLLPYAEKNIPIIGIEPSCLLSFHDEYLNFYPEVTIIAEKSMLFDQFVEKHKQDFPQPQSYFDIAIHTHCHQKALSSSQATYTILKNFTKCNVTEIASGCCGMAGSFGYEKEHYEFSKKIANLVLIPAIHKLPSKAIVVANGFSCRSQIEDFSGRKAYHLAEVLKDIIL